MSAIHFVPASARHNPHLRNGWIRRAVLLAGWARVTSTFLSRAPSSLLPEDFGADRLLRSASAFSASCSAAVRVASAAGKWWGFQAGGVHLQARPA